MTTRGTRAHMCCRQLSGDCVQCQRWRLYCVGAVNPAADITQFSQHGYIQCSGVGRCPAVEVGWPGGAQSRGWGGNKIMFDYLHLKLLIT